MNGHEIEGELFFEVHDAASPWALLLPRSFNFTILEALSCIIDRILTEQRSERSVY